jgi:hypothetical protein
MRQRFRLGRGARLLPVLGTTIALAAAVPSVAAASSSGATAPGFDPQTTNVPYLAWNGEQVRLEKCVPADGLTPQEFNEITSITTPAANFAVEDWSGNNTPDPTINTTTEKIFYSFDFDNGAGGLCASTDVVSLNPGIARIELDVSAFTVPDGTAGYFGPAQPFLAHQFLAAWMTLNTPTLKNMGSSDFGADPSGINDPTGTGTETAGNNPAFLDVNVTGSIPIDGAMDNLFGGSPTSVTLPQDWVTLADALATDDNVDNTTAADDWDTSGSNLDVSGHVPGDCDAYPSNPFGAPAETPDSGAYQSPIDNGDNCSGGGPDGPFSLGNGGLSDAGTTIGPFDPVNASSTDLADGDLNSLDAPMPAARVDVSIAQNSQSSTDTSGVGSLQAANKTDTYSRDFSGDSSDGNLYAPFYDAYIPATARPTDDSSGIDGAFANNFPGFLDISNDGGDYHFWDTYSLGTNTGAPTDCLAYSSDADPQGQQTDPDNSYRQTPSGDYNVAVYTDQNGEAQVEYVPGYGYYFDNLGADMNADGGCDLESVAGPQNPNAITTLGTAAITATAKYPYKSVDFPNETSNTVTETVSNQFDKSLSYAPKGSSAADNNARIVISHAQEIDGSPIVGETVCFSADSNAEGVTRFAGFINGVFYGGSTQVPDPENGLGRLCLTTDQNGNAAIEVDDSNGNMVDVIADYVDEGLLRDIPVDFSMPGSTGGSVPTDPQTQPTSTVGTTSPSTAQVAAVSPGLAAAIHHTIQRHARITVMRLLMPARGRHFLMLRVRSTSRTAHVAMTLTVRSGHHTRTVHRTITVRTNRMIKLMVPRSVTRIKGVHLVR